MTWRRSALALVLLLGSTAPARAADGIDVANLLSARVGNRPGPQYPGDRQDFYDELDLAAAFRQARVGVRFETDRSSDPNDPHYSQITQRWVEWSDPHGRLRIGNFYALLGRGLLHRSFELPGVILDPNGIRSRFAFARDMDGVQGEITAGPVHAQAFSGTGNPGENSPAAEAFGLPRYIGQFSGAEVSVAPTPAARAGAAYARTNAGLASTDESGSGFVEVDPLGLGGVHSVSLPLYFEYAQSNGGFGDWWKFRHGTGTPHALYASTGLLWGRLGASVEWKDYTDFRKGTNDPPSLVREQTWTILNRDTHVLNAGRESGTQAEVTYGIAPGCVATANVSTADGVALNHYRERFFELRFDPADARTWSAGAYLDGTEDRATALAAGHAAGALAEVRLRDRWSVHADVEGLHAQETRGALPPLPYEDLYATLGVGLADRGTVAVAWDRTSNPLVRSVWSGGGAFLHLWSGTVTAHLAPEHDATLTVGRFRGGRACTAGVCYDLPAFDGAELRLVSRF